MHLLTKPFLDRFPGRIVNVHSARSCRRSPAPTPIEDVLAAGVEETGVDDPLVDEGLDTGAVSRQEPVPSLPSDTPESLRRSTRSSTGCYPRW